MDNAMWFFSLERGVMEIKVHTKQKDYSIYLETGLLQHLQDFIDVNKRYYIITDCGVPKQWVTQVTSLLSNYCMYTIEQGEHSKNIQTYQDLLTDMLEKQISRNDTILAIGGGVVGDLAGFVAATYKRGMQVIQIPTTLLAQIDSSIGGKTAIDFAGVKNSVGAFWQPTMVLIDPNTLSTLSPRHLHNGMAEMIKAGLIQDESLFSLFEQPDLDLVVAIQKSIEVKRKIVEMDEEEKGIRKVLNFGHTFGHAIESHYHFETYYHGEAVGIGMVMMIDQPEIQNRLITVLKRYQLPISCDVEKEVLKQYLYNDKKANQTAIDVIKLDQIGKCRIETVDISTL